MIKNNKFNKLMQKLYDSLNSSIDIERSLPLVYVAEDTKTSMEFFNDNILVETKSVFRRSDFTNLTSTLLNMENEAVAAYSRDDLAKIQSLKKFGTWKKPAKRLGIIKSSFNDFNDFCSLIERLVGKIVKSTALIEPFSMLSKSKGMYLPFSSVVGILFINSTKTNEEILCHELIHFFQDVTGQGMVLVEENDKFKPIEQLAKLNELETFGTIKKDLAKLVVSEHEIIPYINSICYQMEKNGVDKDVPIKVINGLIKFMNELKRKNGTLKELKDAIRENVSLAGISMTEFAFLVICLMHGQHLELLKRTVGNYFKDK